MAKAVKAGKTGIKSKKEKFELKFPSKYGSHTSMIVDATADEGAQKFLEGRTLGENDVVCKDENYYLTQKSYLDNGMADPNRMYR